MDTSGTMTVQFTEGDVKVPPKYEKVLPVYGIFGILSLYNCKRYPLAEQGMPFISIK